MKPAILLDKSTIQALSQAEINTLLAYYYPILSPILMREITSMLGKNEDLSELKKKVSIISKKIAGHSACPPNAFKMAYNNLLGSPIPMNGQIPLDNWTVSKVDSEKVIFFGENQNIKTLRKWANNIFSEESTNTGEKIRTIDSSHTWDPILNEQKSAKKILPSFSSLKELVNWIDKVYLTEWHKQELFYKIATHFIASEHIEITKSLWEQMGYPPIQQFAPYAFYCYRVDMIYAFGIIYDFIKRSKKAKPHLDMQYIYYLPFSRVFTSNDKELIKLAPFFIRDNQKLISGVDLKEDLNNIKNHFAGLTSNKNKDISNLKNSFTANIWKKQRHIKPDPITPELHEKLLKMSKTADRLFPL
jgi:hypothetical protein